MNINVKAYMVVVGPHGKWAPLSRAQSTWHQDRKSRAKDLSTLYTSKVTICGPLPNPISPQSELKQTVKIKTRKFNSQFFFFPSERVIVSSVRTIAPSIIVGRLQTLLYDRFYLILCERIQLKSRDNCVEYGSYFMQLKFKFCCKLAI